MDDREKSKDELVAELQQLRAANAMQGADRERLRRVEEELRSRSEPTILVVEGDAQVRTLLVQMLQVLGYAVTQTGSAEEGLHLCGIVGGNLRLIVIDLTLPLGRELMKEARAQSPDVGVLFTSAGGQEASLGPPGQSAFLAKPFVANDFVQIVRNLLGLGPASDGASG